MNMEWHSIWSKQKSADELELNGWEKIDTAFNDLRVPYVTHFAQLDSTSSILDIGCGTGMLLNSLPGSKKVGVDFSPRQINQSHHKNIEFYCGDFLDLNFGQTFDTVMCFSAFQYVESNKAEAFVAKAVSLANKTVCFFDVPNANNIVENQAIRVSKKPDIGFFHKEFFSKFSNDVFIQDWNMPFYRFNNIRYNVRIKINS